MNQNYAQVIINNISFPRSIDGLRHYIYNVGHFDIEDILYYNDAPEWTVPKWIQVGDIVLFFHAKTAKSSITKLESELNVNMPNDYKLLMEKLQQARKLYNQYGGKIFAIGRINGYPFYDDEEPKIKLHFKSKIYARISDIYILDNPIHIDEFSSFIKISRQSAITPVIGNDFDKLRKIIEKNNINIPLYFKKSCATPMPLNKINEKNWLQITQEYRRKFKLEIQFRKFYTNYFLEKLGDMKKIFLECACFHNEKCTGYVDNVIKIKNKLCCVEIKLNINAEKYLKSQLKKYCKVSKMEIEKNRWEFSENIIQNYVIVIDTEKIGIFNNENDNIEIIEFLDNIKNDEDIKYVKEKIKNIIYK